MLSVFSLFVMFILLLGGYGWSIVIGQLKQREAPLMYESRSEVPWGLFDLVLTIVLMAILMAAGFSVLRIAMSIPADVDNLSLSPRQLAGVLLVNGIANLLVLPLSCLLLSIRVGATLRDLGIDGRRFAGDIKTGFFAFAMIAPPVYAIQFVLTQWFPSNHPLMEMVEKDPSPVFFIVSGFTAVIVAPLAEEYLFRLLLQGWLERAAMLGGDLRTLLFGGNLANEPLESTDHYEPDGLSESNKPTKADTEDRHKFSISVPAGDSAADVKLQTNGGRRHVPYWPIFVSAALFALMHANHGPDPIPLFILACCLGYLYRQTHRIAPCVVVHLLLNATSMAAMILGILYKQT